MEGTGERAKTVELPEGTEEVAGWSDLSAAWATMQRGQDGTVYFVAWWYGTPRVKCAVYPDGSSWVDEE